MNDTLPLRRGPRAIARRFVAILIGSLPLAAQANSLNGDSPSNEWDFVGEILANADTINNTFTDASGIVVTMQVVPVRGTVDTRSTDGTYPARDSLDEMLKADGTDNANADGVQDPGEPGIGGSWFIEPSVASKYQQESKD